MDTLQDTLDEESIGEVVVNSNDPCDKCRMGSRVRALNKDGHDLTFCGHHGRLYEKVLEVQGFKLYWSEE